VPRPAGCELPKSWSEPEPVPRWCEVAEIHYVVIPPHRPNDARHYRFIVPIEDFADIAKDFATLASRWRGGEGGMLDGTSITVEAWREGHLRSIMTNETQPDNPAAMTALGVHRMLLAYAPSGTVPRARSFDIADDGSYPCQTPGFATSDPDGLGVGDDACARQRSLRGSNPPARNAQPAGSTGNAIE